jgi:hypothetical protein
MALALLTTLNLFLTPPSQLALMLQNSLFREEVNRTMGRSSGAAPNTSNSASRGDTEGERMLSAVTSMGSAAKSTLTSMALRFRNAAAKATGSSSSSTGGFRNEQQTREHKREGGHLLSASEEEDEPQNPLMRV